MVISIAIKWPVAGLLFGFIRNEGLDWRKDPARLKAYRLGTWVIVAVLVLRLLVQVPLYLMGEDGLAALATTRLIMAAPLYILGVWVAWLITRPAPAGLTLALSRRSRRLPGPEPRRAEHPRARPHRQPWPIPRTAAPAAHLLRRWW